MAVFCLIFLWCCLCKHVFFIIIGTLIGNRRYRDPIGSSTCIASEIQKLLKSRNPLPTCRNRQRNQKSLLKSRNRQRNQKSLLKSRNHLKSHVISKSRTHYWSVSDPSNGDYTLRMLGTSSMSCDFHVSAYARVGLSHLL